MPTRPEEEIERHKRRLEALRIRMAVLSEKACDSVQGALWALAWVLGDDTAMAEIERSAE